ncbi:MAG: DUF2339 domain-containing protein [Acidobacteriota bacterium]
MVFLLFVAVGVLGFIVFGLKNRVGLLDGLLRGQDDRLNELQLEVGRLAQRTRDASLGPVNAPAEGARPAPAASARVPLQPDVPVHTPAAPIVTAPTPLPSSPAAPSASPPTPVPPVPAVASDVPFVAAAAAVAAAMPGREAARALKPAATEPPIHVMAGAGVGSEAAAPEPETAADREAGPGGFDWESLVGVKFFSAVAGVALVVAAIFFLRFSIEQGWLGPPVRMAIGVLTAAGLLAFSERRAAGRYRITADALDVAGVTILYATFFAAHSLWQLIGTIIAFVLLVAVTLIAILLALRRSSPLIAGLGLLGGFAAPALLSSGEDNPFTLFGYLIVLNTGLAWVARHKRWAPLVGVSLLFTTLYQWGWVAKFLTPEKVPVAVSIFLIFPALAFTLLFLGGMTGPPPNGERAWHGPFRTLALASAMLPLLILPVLTMAPYGNQYGWLFVFLLLLASGYLAMAIALRREEIHLLGALATVVVTLLWAGAAYSSAAWPVVLGIIAVFVALYLLAPAIGSRFGITFAGDGRHAALASPLLLVSFAVLVVREPETASPAMAFGVLFVLLAAVAAYAVVRRYPAAYLAGAAAALLAEVFWSAKYLEPSRLVPALTVYGTFGILFLAVPVAARRTGRQFDPAVAYLGLSGFLFLLRIAGDPSLAVPPWPWFGALAVLAVAVGAAALDLGRGGLQVAATSFVIVSLLAWETAAQRSPWPSVALAGAIVTALYGTVWAWLAARAKLAGGLLEWTVVVGLVGGQVAAIGASIIPGAPSLTLLVGAHLILLLAVLTVSWRARWPVLAPAAVLVLGFATLFWASSPHTGADWRRVLLFALVPYAIFVAYPLVLGRRVGAALSPYLTAVLANVPFFLAAHWSLKGGGFGAYIGALPIVQALVMAGLLAVLLRIERASARAEGRLALVAAAVLAGVTVAIPLQLDRQWLTVGWALEGAALAWLFTRIPHRGLLWWCVGLLAAVFARLVLNPEVFAYAPRSTARILNWYLYTYATCSAAFLFAWAALRRRDDFLLRDEDNGSRTLRLRLSHLAAAGAVVLLFVLVNIEIADFYSVGTTITFGFGVRLAQDLTYTLAWGIYGVALLAIGIVMRARAARATALALLVVTVFKCFLYDLGRLEGLYRVASFVGLAMCLALVAVALQKYVLGGRKSGS